MVQIHSPDRGVRDRLVAALLLALIGVGCFALWLGIPALTLLVLSRVVDPSSNALVLYALILVPTAMVAFTWLLVLANRQYGRITRRRQLRRGELPQPSSPFELMLTVSLTVAIVALIVWFLFFADSPPWVTV
jgi:hypothetical protein